MSYYDPLLQELEQLDQPNYLTQSGQAMSMRGAPINAGGGFWSNLAAQLVPGLLGAGMSYIGQQQNRGAEADLLEAAKLGDAQQVADSLISTGHEGLAARVLMAAKEQEALARAEQAKLQQTMLYDEWKMGKDLQGKKELEGIKSSRIGANAANKLANDILVAQIGAGAESEKATRAAELQFIDKGSQLPGVQLVNKTAPFVQSLEALAKAAEERGYATGAEAVTAWNQGGRASTPEALSDFGVRQMMAAEGFQGEVDQWIGWATNKGRVSPTIIRAIAEASKKTQAGRELDADRQIAALANQYGTITKAPERFDALKPSYQKMAQGIASEMMKGPQPVQMPKPVTEGSLKEASTVTNPRLLKEGEIGKFGGKIYTRVNGQLMEGSF